MNTVDIGINAAIFCVTLAIVASGFWHEGRWQPRKGLKSFRYFTVLSNALCAVAALAVAVGGLRGGPSEGVLRFKYLGTVSVTVTMLTVLLFLGPTQGYGAMLRGTSAYMHLIGPLLAIASYCAFEGRGMALGEAMSGVIPVLAYGAVYLYMVILAPEQRRWEDFYGFNRGGRWPAAFAAMLAGAAAVCAAFWAVGPQAM